MKYIHTNLIVKDIKAISEFYINVFDCKQVGKDSVIKGDWVDKGTGLEKAEAKSVVLKLPGYEKDGPTLEIFQYTDTHGDEYEHNANTKGFGHIAFSVEDVENVVEKVKEFGGGLKGELTKQEFSSGTLTYVYLTDPEGNIIEVQSWVAKG